MFWTVAGRCEGGAPAEQRTIRTRSWASLLAGFAPIGSTALRPLLLLLLASTLQLREARGAVYQYQVMEGSRSVYLWVPPQCQQVRGLIVSFKNLTEQRWLEDPQVRSAASDECLGIVWIGDGQKSELTADMDGGAGEAFLAMQRDLAEVSGYPEIATAPILPMGHSAHGQFAWRFAEWAPQRTIAALPIKTMPLPEGLNLRGVPMMYIVGETTEWPQYRDGSRPGDRDFFWPEVRQSALAIRTRYPNSELGVAVDPGGGHFDWSPEMAKLVALFIRKACALRLPPEASGADAGLRPLPFESGWLDDSGGLNPDRFAPAPSARFRGPRHKAYWFFDREMVEAVVRMQGDRRKRAHQMLSFVQDGKTLPVADMGFAALKFEPAADGINFDLHPVFLSTVPKELVGAGTPLGHASKPIKLSVITGPLEQTGPTAFRVAWSREAIGGDAWIEEEQEGDAHFRKAVQPGRVQLPRPPETAAPKTGNTENPITQTISFLPLADINANQGEIPLQASASSGLPVRFFVLAGPAEIEGDRLRITQVPRGGSKSIKVTVVAYQAGNSGTSSKDAKFPALPVTRSFFVTRK